MPIWGLFFFSPFLPFLALTSSIFVSSTGAVHGGEITGSYAGTTTKEWRPE
jgi:hypothetical protein